MLHWLAIIGSLESAVVQESDWRAVEAQFVIGNDLAEPMCFNTSAVTDGYLATSYELRSNFGDEIAIVHAPTTFVVGVATAPSWVIVPPNSSFHFSSDFLLTGREFAHGSATAARLSFFTLPCDFIMDRYMHLDPNSEDEDAQRIYSEADRLVEYRMTDWTDLTEK